MDNTTKALIVAVAVLIVIIIISLGINVMNSTGGVAEQEEVVGNAISDKTYEASEHVVSSTNKIEHIFHGSTGNAGTGGSGGTGGTNSQPGANNEIIIDQWGDMREKPSVQGETWYISTPNQLDFFADYVNGELSEKDKSGFPEITRNTVVCLEKDLNLRNIDWTPIGKDENNTFIGTFDGKGHKISGLKVNVQNYAGLFGCADNTIKNVTIKDSTIEGKGDFIGAIAGKAKNIENCKSENNTIKGTQYVGGIIGYSLPEGVIKNCINTSKVSSLPDEAIKATYPNNRLEDYGTHTGGIVGRLADGTVVSGCINKGKIESNYSRVGGIAGDTAVSNIIITNCVNEGEIISVSKKEQIGGIVRNNSYRW